jgi:hypothetical protein
VSIIVDVEGIFMRMREFYPAYRKRQYPAVGRWLCTCCKRSSDWQLLQNDGTTRAAYCIKFCQKLDDAQVETFWKIQQAFRDDAMSIARIKEWYNRFKDGSTSVESETCHGTLSTSWNDNVINKVRTLLEPHGSGSWFIFSRGHGTLLPKGLRTCGSYYC